MRDITLAWNMDNTQLNQSYILWQQINNSISNIDKKLQGIQTTGFDNASLNDYIKKINNLNQSIENLFSSLKGIIRIKPDFNPLITKINELKDLLSSLNKIINTINNKDINIQAKNINNVISRLEALDKAMKNMNNKMTINIDTQNAIQNVKELNKELLKAKRLFDQVNQQRTQRQPTQPTTSQRQPSGGSGGGGIPRPPSGGMQGMSGMQGMGNMGGLGGALGRLGPYAAAASKAIGMVTDAVKVAYNAVLGLDDLIDDFSNNKIVKAVSVYEKYEAALYTLSGSHIQARNTLAGLQQFAKSTPFEFEEITQTYIKLANRGVSVNNDLLTSLGDIAAAQGKGMDQMTEAFLDGQMGQYRRFIEFGIKVSKEGTDTVLKMGSKIGKGKDMEEAIKDLAKKQGVIGGMSNQAISLGGMISNVTDSISIMFTKIGQIPLVRKGFEMFLNVIGNIADKIALIATRMSIAMGPFKDSLFDQEAVTGEMDHFFYALSESQQQSLRGISKHLKIELSAMAKAAAEANEGNFNAMKMAGIEMKKEGDKMIATMGDRSVIAESAEDAIDKLAKFTYEVERLNEKNQTLWKTFDSDLQRQLNTISSNAKININSLIEATNEAYKGTHESYNKLRALGFKITEEQGAFIMEYNGKIVKGLDSYRLMKEMGVVLDGMSDLSEKAKFLGVDWGEVWDSIINYDYGALWDNIINFDWLKDIDLDWSFIWKSLEKFLWWLNDVAIPAAFEKLVDVIHFLIMGPLVAIWKIFEQLTLGMIELFKPLINSFDAWIQKSETLKVIADYIKNAWLKSINAIKDAISSILNWWRDVRKNIYDDTDKITTRKDEQAEMQKKCIEGQERRFIDGRWRCVDKAPIASEDKSKTKKQTPVDFTPRDIEAEKDLYKWSETVYQLAKADEELRKASIELQKKRLDENAKPEDIKKLEVSIIEKQWQKENIIRDDIRKRNEEREKVSMNTTFNIRKQNLERTAAIEKWSKEKMDIEKTKMEVDRLEADFALKQKYHAVDIYEIEDNENKIKEKKEELKTKHFLEELKKEEELKNLANEQSKKIEVEKIEMQVNSQLISKEEGEVRKLKIEMDAHEKAMSIKEQYNNIEFIEDQKYANERLDYLSKLYKAELELLIANENKKLETITDITNKKIKAMETEFDRLMQVQDRYAKLANQASEISDLIKANLELSKNDQLFNERLNEYIEKRTQINNDLLKAQANKDTNAISIFTNKLKELSTAFENTEEQYYNAANQITNKITDMGIDFFNTTNKNIKAINDEFVKQSQTSIKELGKLDSQLADVYKKGVDLTNTGHKVVLEGINQISETMGTMMASIDEYNKKLNELGVEYDRLSENERLHAENAVEAQKKIYEWERKRGGLQAMLNSTGLDVDGMRQVQDEINRLDLSIFNKKQQLQSEENAVSIAKRSKDVIEKQINSVNFDKFKTQLQSTIKGLEEIFDSIEQKRLENVDKMIDKHKAEMEAIKEKAAEEQKLLELEMQRQAIINKLAEQRLKELQDLSKTVPAAQKERIEKEMEEERKKIKDLNKEKDKAKKLEEKRLKDEQEKIKKLEEEKRAIQHEQFEISRVAQTVQVVMNTAEAISKAYAQGGMFATIFVPVIVAMGAIQAATIMGQPNPYHEGTLSVPGQGDKDTVPAILTPGEAVIPKHTNLLYKDSIDTIFNHKISPTILNDFVKNYRIKKVDMNGGIMINQNNMSNIDIERLIKAIENKKMVSVTIDNEGINTYINHVNTKTKILDKKLHRKI